MVKVYKTFEECRQEKLLFIQPAFAEGIDDTQRRILKCHPDLNRDFLDEDELDNDVPTEGALASGVEVASTK